MSRRMYRIIAGSASVSVLLLALSLDHIRENLTHPQVAAVSEALMEEETVSTPIDIQEDPVSLETAETAIPPALSASQEPLTQTTIIEGSGYAYNNELSALISIVSGLTGIVSASLDSGVDRTFIYKQADAIIDPLNDSIDDTNDDLSDLTADVDDLSDELAALATSVATSSFAQGGNAFGTTAALGTTDNQPFSLITNGIERLTVTEDGNVGIGTSTPSDPFTVQGTSYLVGNTRFGNNIAIGTSSMTNAVNIYGTSSGGSTISITNPGNNEARLITDSNRSGVNSSLFEFRGLWNGTMVAALTFKTGPDTTNKDDGRLTFMTATGGVLSERMRIDENGNVGIGTTNPSAFIDDAGGLIVAGQIRANGITNTAANPIYLLNDTNTGFFYPASNSIGFSVGAFEAMRITSAGNIGIGTTTPGRTLTVIGAQDLYAANTHLRFFDTDTVGYSYVERNGSRTNFGNNNGTSSAINMVINDSGNVGISITNPSARFSLGTGTSTIKAAMYDGGSTNLYGIGYNTSALTFGAGLTATGTPQMVLTSTGNVGIGTTSPQAPLHVYQLGAGAGFYLSRDGFTTAGLTISSAASLSVLGIGNTSSSFQTTFNLDNGNVGVGTTRATNRLTVVSPSVASSTVRLESPRVAIVNGDILGGLDFASNDTNLTTPGTTTASILAVAATAHTASALGTDLVFNTTNGTLTAEGMRILGNGNVGIGTTSPGARLDVAGDIWGDTLIATGGAPDTGSVSLGVYGGGAWLNTPAGTNGFLGLGGSGVFKWGTAEIAINDSSADYDFRVESDTNTHALFVQGSDGNVGIGASTPTYRLQVAPASQYTALNTGDGFAVYNPTLTSANVIIGVNSGASNIIQSRAGATSNNLSINPFGGNVAIGTTSPGAQLDVMNANGGTLRLSRNDATLTGETLGTLEFYSNDADDASVRASVSALKDDTSLARAPTALVFSTGDNTPASLVERMRITSSGNVGIGTTTPASKLDVYSSSAGLLSLTRSTGAGWLDFFEGGTRKAYIGYESSGGNGIATGALANALVLKSQTGPVHIISSAGSATNGITVATSGSVGIGTTTPESKLSIYHPASNTPGATTVGLNYGAGDLWGFRLGATDFDFNIDRKSGGTWESALTIDRGNGYVGIGTTSPQAKLEIYNSIISTLLSGDSIFLRNHHTGAGWARALLGFEDDAGNDYWQIGGYGTGQTSTYGYLGQAYNDAALKWNASNQLGIGLSSNISPALQLAIGDANTGLAQTAEDTLHIYTGNVQRMTFDSNGNVGIGTTTPYAPLSVTNTGSAPSLVVEDSASDNTPFVVDTDGRVGIFGSPVGNNSLTINETFSGRGIVLGDRTLNGTLYFGRSAGGGLGGNAAWIGLGGDGTASNNWLSFSGYGAEDDMRITAEGNIGIGTTSPSQRLTVEGTSNIFGVIRGGSSTGRGLFINPSTGDTVSIKAADYTGNSTLNTGFAFDVSNGSASTAMVIKHTGNIGIGATDPGVKLDIRGSISTTSGGLFIGHTNLSQALSFGYSGIAAAGTTANQEISLSSKGTGDINLNPQSGDVVISTNNSTSELHLVGLYGPDLHLEATGAANSQIILENNNNVQTILTTPSSIDSNADMFSISNTNGVTINNGELVVNTDGNIGIGTTTPNHLLTVSSNNTNTTDSQLTIEQLGTGDAWMNFSIPGGNHWAVGIDNSDEDKFKIGETTSASGVSVGTALTIDTLGHVGIGTTTPTEGLTVVRNSSNGFVARLFQDHAAGDGLYIDADGDSVAEQLLRIDSAIGISLFMVSANGAVALNDTSPDFRFEIAEPLTNGYFGISSSANNDGDVFIIDNTGNVGIDTTTNLFAKLTVNGNIGTVSEGDIFSQYDGSSATSYPVLARYWDTSATAFDGGTYLFGNGASAYVGIEKPGGSNVSTFQVKADTAWFNGNVGIGTTSPSSKLHVAGDIRTDNSFILTGVSNFSNDGSNNLAIRPSNNIVKFQSGNGATDYMTINNGNVGIGTTTPTEMLTVAGSARFTGVSSGAHVFDLNLTADGTLTTSASDRRLKTQEMLLDTANTLEKLLALQPKSFVWKETNSKDIGLIAQEVEEVFPEIVFTNPNDGYMGINYSRLPALIIAGIQELAAKVSELFARDEERAGEIDRLEQQNAALNDRVQALEAALNIEPEPEPESDPEPEPEPVVQDGVDGSTDADPSEPPANTETPVEPASEPTVPTDPDPAPTTATDSEPTEPVVTPPPEPVEPASDPEPTPTEPTADPAPAV